MNWLTYLGEDLGALRFPGRPVNPFTTDRMLDGVWKKCRICGCSVALLPEEDNVCDTCERR